LGGMFEVVVTGMPIGIGSYVHADKRLDGILAGAILSIPAIKAAAVGLSKKVTGLPGSEVHDRIFPSATSTGIERQTNNAGGIEGGMTNGEPVRVRAVMKPLASLSQPLDSVNMATGEPVMALRERSDVCAVPAAAVVAEAVVMLALMNPFLEKFGGDSLEEIRTHIQATPPLPWK
ncbi:chorismate synthase, partial [bacterium]|nr:chorismate synthase [bacterium]